ncbi:C69 family dipeptidase [Oscillatoria salina]|uniref:C69 family dipeptidase n=1 Tax=Oscillatoria salina TaxID=331517 RepID=UPI0013B66F1D|nr:C69 family dipeptidase [Oscillatoria salina]MBZ8182815.1 peptidase C69 [Oscillatoria salina IIICB1]NET91220.1 peptidase C69 [Kamptonema sp. SIO1D9]
MCDTFVALPDATKNGDLIFGKNSDRPAGELQNVVTIPAQNHPQNSQLKCTYITIPQGEKTLAVILSQPQWMWGAEMGANECGVVIGNEAVWTTQSYQNTGLLGMDLVRLGLERGETAYQALQIIINLLDKYGQGGNCAENFAMNYHNSFLIADTQEAWVLETAGKYWVAEKITSGTRSISNNLSIRNQGNLRHSDLIKDAFAIGLYTNEDEFDFAKIFSEGSVEDTLSPHSREGKVRHLCKVNQGKFTIDTAKSILREHSGNICMHGAFISAGSQISSLSLENCQHWFIEKPFPCQQEYQQKDFSALVVQK